MPDKQPPFRPDVPCVSQDLPNLTASISKPAAQARTISPRAATGPKVERLANRIKRVLGR
jgi:hypothetical protein